MKISYDINHFILPASLIALTIGNFDGFHLGHQALLNRLKQTAPYTIVLTFSNHPSEVLNRTPISYLTTLAHRLTLLERAGINETFLIPFSESFSKQTAHLFLSNLKEKIPFNYLLLGHDAVIGHDRKKNLYDLSEIYGFSLEYLEPVRANGKIISSSEIRRCLKTGNLQAAGQLLGRPYSIFACVQHGSGIGGALGFHTANLPVEDLALPPLGVYAVNVKIYDETFPGVANLGYAPTLHQNRKPCLEVHLIDANRNLYDQELEVFFLKYIRAEKRFENLTALKTQIQKDVESARKLFTTDHIAEKHEIYETFPD